MHASRSIRWMRQKKARFDLHLVEQFAPTTNLTESGNFGKVVVGVVAVGLLMTALMIARTHVSFSNQVAVSQTSK